MQFEMPVGFELQDDLDVSLNPEDYRDAPLPTPIHAGNYAGRIVKAGLKTLYEKPDEVVLVKDDNGVPTYPVIVIRELEVVRPEEFDGRKIFPQGFGQEFGTKPYMRTDYSTQERYPANNLADMLRSHDSSIAFRGLREGQQRLEQIMSEGGLFHFQIEWVAEDREFIKNEIEELKAALEDGRLGEDEFTKLSREVRYKKGRLEGMNKFIDPETGSLVPSWLGPSGEEVEARAFIKKWISLADLGKPGLKLGAKTVKGSKRR